MDKLSIADLNKLKPTQVIKENSVRQRFVKMHMSVHKSTEEESEAFYYVVSEQLVQKIIDDNFIMDSVGYSAYNCMLDIATWGLPIVSGSDTLVYIVGGNVNKGTKDAPRWTRVMTVEQSVNGKEAASIMAGQLLRCSDVTLVREGEQCNLYVDANGNKSVEYKGAFDAKGKIVGGFIRLTFPDNSFEYVFNPYSEIERLKKYSEKKNRGTASELYTKGENGQGDVGFVKTKFKKLALKVLPQLCMSQYSLVSAADYTEGYEKRFAAGLDSDDYEQESFGDDKDSQEPNPPTQQDPLFGATQQQQPEPTVSKVPEYASFEDDEEIF